VGCLCVRVYGVCIQKNALVCFTIEAARSKVHYLNLPKKKVAGSGMGNILLCICNYDCVYMYACTYMYIYTYIMVYDVFRKRVEVQVPAKICSVSSRLSGRVTASVLQLVTCADTCLF